MSETRKQRIEVLNAIVYDRQIPSYISKPRVGETKVRISAYLGLSVPKSNSLKEEMSIINLYKESGSFDTVSAFQKANNIKSQRLYDALFFYGEFQKLSTSLAHSIIKDNLVNDYIPDNRTTKSMSVRRKGQRKFELKQQQIWNGICPISGTGVLKVLQAIHITPFRETQDNSAHNGMLMRADLHRLFDSGLLTLQRIGNSVMVSVYVDDPEYARYDGKVFYIPAEVQDNFLK